MTMRHSHAEDVRLKFRWRLGESSNSGAHIPTKSLQTAPGLGRFSDPRGRLAKTPAPGPGARRLLRFLGRLGVRGTDRTGHSLVQTGIVLVMLAVVLFTAACGGSEKAIPTPSPQESAVTAVTATQVPVVRFKGVPVHPGMTALQKPEKVLDDPCIGFFFSFAPNPSPFQAVVKNVLTTNTQCFSTAVSAFDVEAWYLPLLRADGWTVEKAKPQPEFGDAWG